MLWEASRTEPNAFQDKFLLKIEFGKLIHSGPVSFPTEVWWEIPALGNWDLIPRSSSVSFQLSYVSPGHVTPLNLLWLAFPHLWNGNTLTTNVVLNIHWEVERNTWVGQGQGLSSQNWVLLKFCTPAMMVWAQSSCQPAVCWVLAKEYSLIFGLCSWLSKASKTWHIGAWITYMTKKKKKKEPVFLALIIQCLLEIFLGQQN